MGKKYRVTENNGGGLSLVVWDDGNGNAFAHAGYEYNVGQLSKDLMALVRDDVDVSKWENNELLDEGIASNYRESMEDNYDDNGNFLPLRPDDYYDDDPSTKTIVCGDDNCVTYQYGHMGQAGQLEFIRG